MLTPFVYPALVTVLALMVYLVQAIKVGKARQVYAVQAPATTGHEVFERIYRVQMNTLEQLVLFLPVLWLCAIFAQVPLMASAVGLIWVVGRVIYARCYYAGTSRMLGFVLTLAASMVLLLGTVMGIVLGLWAA